MDYVLSIGISKMPKIPDKSNIHFFLSLTLKKNIPTTEFNPTL